MLQTLPSFRATCGPASVGADDITVIYGVRAHADNPWLLERIDKLGAYYDPLPQVMVVDLGSDAKHAAALRATCDRHGHRYRYVDDRGTFSLAKARNVGATLAKTSLLFFSDADCFGERDLFSRLVDHANALDMGRTLDQLVVLPVYHLGQATTAAVWTQDNEAMSLALRRAMTQQVYEEASSSAFVDPSSNFFLLSRDFFDFVGGYNEEFRGHGSEDFEFFVRAAHYTKTFPHPTEFGSDLFSPARDDFYAVKDYRGYRRYCELVAFRAETSGLRIAHLYHPRGDGAWYREYDRRKQRLRSQLAPLLDEPAHLLTYDWMPRDKEALVLLHHRHQFEYFAPLRAAGYRLHLMLSGDAESEAQARRLIDSGTLDAVAVFNPYMSSHRDLAPLVERARSTGHRMIVIDRGLLPESWFYADDMPYADPAYSSLSAKELTISETERGVANEYLLGLRKGAFTLEANNDFAETASQYHRTHQRTIFIPLQLPDDVAVTHFDDGFLPYPDFVASLDQVIAAFPQARFLIKPHPLSKLPVEVSRPNAVLCTRDDNIHALIENADATICYNSGVGFLALCHSSKVVTVGNAFYNLEGLGSRAKSLGDAVELVLRDAVAEPDPEHMTRFVGWLIYHQYAFCSARSRVRELPQRRVHDYHDLAFYHCPWSPAWSHLRAPTLEPGLSRSYASGKLGMGVEAPRPRWVVGSRTQAAQRKLRKLVRDPKRFFWDAGLNLLDRLKRQP